MSEVIDIITRLKYIAEDEGLKKSSEMILKQTNQLLKLEATKQQIHEKISKLDKNDLEAKKKYLTQLKSIDDATRKIAQSTINERLQNEKLNKELVKEIGLITNLEQKLEALKTKKSFAQTAKEVDAVNKEITSLSNQLDKLDGKKSQGGGGGFLSSILSGVGIGTGMELFNRAIGAIGGVISDANREFEEAEASSAKFYNTLSNIGQVGLFEELSALSDNLAESYKNLFDNDDITSGQIKFIEGTKVSKSRLQELIPVAIELAAKLGTDVTTASEMLVNSIIGRTSPELKRLGLNMKGAGDETERVNRITGDFAQLLRGSVDSALNTTIGKTQQYNQEIANMEEELGKAIAPMKKQWLEIKLNTINGLNEILDVMDNANSTASERFVALFSTSMQSMLKLRVAYKKEIKDSTNEIISDDIKLQKAIEQGKKLGANQGVISYWENVLKDRKNKSNLSVNKRGGADSREETETKNEIKKEVKKIVTQSREELNKPENKVELPLVFTIAKEGNLPTDAETEFQKYEDEQTKRLKEVFSKISLESLGLPEGENASESEILNREKIKVVEVEKKSLNERIQLYNDYIQSVGGGLQNLLAMQTATADRQLSIEQKRIEDMREYADRGGAEMLQAQELRIREAEIMREKAVKRELILNNALALSSAIAGVAKAGAEGGALAPVTIASFISALVAGYGLVKSFEPVALNEGTEFVDKAGKFPQGIDKVPARLNRGERVITTAQNAKLKGITNESLVDYALFGQKMSMNYQKVQSNYSSNISTKRLEQLMALNIEAIENKPVPKLIADSEGIRMITMQYQATKRRRELRG